MTLNDFKECTMTLDNVAEQLSPLVTECKRYSDYYYGTFTCKPIFKISQNGSKVLIHVLCWDDSNCFHKETTVPSKAINYITKSIKWIKDYNLHTKLEEIKNDFN